MIKKFALLAAVTFLLFFTTSSFAADIALYDWAFYADGSVTSSNLDYNPPTGSYAGLDSSGLGTINLSTDVDGDHAFIAGLDYEIVEEDNTFYNEEGVATGIPATGQVWEIDDPYWTIYYVKNYADYELSNYNWISTPQDVSFALGWEFSLAANEVATLTFTIADVLPDTEPAFYLTQTDPDSQASIYFWSSLTVEDDGVGSGEGVIPEPSTYLLFAFGIAGLGLYNRRRNAKK